MGQRQSKGNEDVEARWKEFWDDHKDFDSAWARNVLHMLSEFLPFVFKFEAVKCCVEQLYTKSIDVQFPADWDWSRDWTNADEHLPAATLRQLPIFRLALALEAYAYYGLKQITDNDFHGLDRFLEDLPSRLFSRRLGNCRMASASSSLNSLSLCDAHQRREPVCLGELPFKLPPSLSIFY